MGRYQARQGPVFPAGEAMLLFVLAAVSLVLLSALIPALGVTGIVLAQVLAIGGIPALAAWLRHGAAAPAALGLRRPRLRALAGAAAVGLSFWYVNLWIAVPLSEHLGDGGDVAQLEALVAETPLWLILVAMAVTPAVCEELLVRGLVTRALAPRLGRTLAILASAALFALLHASPTRLLPTACFGVLLAHTALAAGSVIPGMLMHALNNAMALLLATNAWPALTAALTAHPAAFLAGALTTCIIGLAAIHPAQGDPG
ncbi:MAG TPA: CPBP family intramembrane glutamic endopeptidase [Haliangium sp.]|nr:CPBP family intramembrane glutamic endopeptidase [Haliangium sp.]